MSDEKIQVMLKDVERASTTLKEQEVVIRDLISQNKAIKTLKQRADELKHCTGIHAEILERLENNENRLKAIEMIIGELKQEIRG